MSSSQALHEDGCSGTESPGWLVYERRPAPAWLRWSFGLLVAVIVPVYWDFFGPGNFLWFSDIALIGGLVALWTRNRMLASMMAVGVLLPELAWNVDFLGLLATGDSALGVAAYMVNPEIPSLVRALSLYHVPLPLLLLWMLWRWGHDRHAWLLQTALAWVVLPASWLLTAPERNVNWVWGWGPTPQTTMPPLTWLLATMVLAPLLLYLPTHLTLRRVFESYP